MSGAARADIGLNDEDKAEAILEHCVSKTKPIRDRSTYIKDKLKLYTKECTRLTEDVQIDRGCLINDAIYGPVQLTPLMYKMINTSEFHRLKEIKQLGAAHYVYPGANHTRFDHSIGVCHLAGVFACHLQEQLQKDCKSTVVQADPDWKDMWVFDDKEVLCVQLAGLCHDLGHGPYSHMFEENILLPLGEEQRMTHDELSVKIFRRMLVENPKVLVQFVRAGLDQHHVQMIEWMIQPDKLPQCERKRAFLYEIVYNKINGVDVNKWDCYARDCHYLGVTSDFQWSRCKTLGRIVKCTVDTQLGPQLRIAFRDKQLDDIYGMYRTGVILHQRAHQHKTIKAVEKMISDAFKEIYTSLKLIHGRDGTAKTIIEAIEEAKKDNLEWFLALNDSIISTIKCAHPKSDDQKDIEALNRAKILLRRVEERDLYHMAGKQHVAKMYSVLPTNEHLQDNEAVWKATMETVRQPNSEEIHRKLDENTKKEIDEDDIWVVLAQFKFSPDTLAVANEGNPAEKVLFYKKQEMHKETELLTRKDIREMSSLLVVPQAFAECERRVYDTRTAEKRKKEHEDALKTALQKWKEEILPNAHDHDQQLLRSTSAQ